MTTGEQIAAEPVCIGFEGAPAAAKTLHCLQNRDVRRASHTLANR